MESQLRSPLISELDPLLDHIVDSITKRDLSAIEVMRLGEQVVSRLYNL